MEDKWINVRDKYPEVGKVVDTRTEDENGFVSNEQTLFLSIDGLWWAPDFSMYLDKSNAPTHWKQTS